jgi:Cytochrome C oxidase, cbb3-type, subunit III
LRRINAVLAVLALVSMLLGCRDDMRNQARHRPLDGSAFFEDGRSARPLVEGTVARGYLREDRHLYEGKIGEEFVKTFPFPITRDVLARGRERFDIYCTPCHDHTGSGNGMIVRRGFRKPSSFHIPRLQDAPAGYLFDVMTNGFGTMQSYATMVPVRDRWAIAAYIRALQLSQNATIADVPAAERARLEVEPISQGTP